jgi:hypothetical protein
MSDDQRPEGAEGRGPLDVEAAFADIVAHWDDTSRTPIGSWPAQEDIPPIIIGDDLTDDEDDEDEGVSTGGAVSSYDVPLVPTDWAPRRAEPAEDIEGFVPPDPPPLPRGDLVSWLAWTAVIGGPLFLLLASQVWTDIGRIWIMLAVLAFIGGFAAIVARLPNSRNDDDPDDGAVV